ncbi:helix-turn-helix domain-containing protein [Nocardioides sp. GXZ039]|uniref:helix-turn-helix domain-containing protein n=1 Tax=Nocardioides sp. GXZ039 TaxID=3136018 RepID=UPI0030F3B7D8
MPDRDALELGRRIRRLRKSHGQSLADVARGTSLTESFLSRLERGHTGVTVDTLRRIAAFWDAEIVDLLQRDAGPQPLMVRGGEGPALEAEATGALRARAETLIPRSGTALQATLYRTEAGGGRFEAFSHEGEELIFVVSGRVTYIVGDETYELESGDALWHSSDSPHRWEARDGDAVSLHVNTPPKW